MRIDHLTKLAVEHTLHCLLGCSIGEILGMVIATAFDWGNAASIITAIALAFLFGYLLTYRSVYRKEKDHRRSAKITLTTDTVSITSMETVDNLIIIVIPGALSAELDSALFWWSLVVSLIIAFVITVPVNRFMIARSGHGHHHH